jgi:hypothetical protein
MAAPVYLALRDTRDLSHMPKHVATTVRTAIVEGASVADWVPAETGISIPSAQGEIPNNKIPSRFIMLTSPAGHS